VEPRGAACTGTRAYVHAQIHTLVHTHTHTTHMRTGMRACMHAHTHTRVLTRPHTCTHAQARALACTRKHTPTCTHAHTHAKRTGTHACACVHLQNNGFVFGPDNNSRTPCCRSEYQVSKDAVCVLLARACVQLSALQAHRCICKGRHRGPEGGCWPLLLAPLRFPTHPWQIQLIILASLAWLSRPGGRGACVYRTRGQGVGGIVQFDVSESYPEHCWLEWRAKAAGGGQFCVWEGRPHSRAQEVPASSGIT